ncbi:MAG: hypothetical protein HY721_20230, partial [Planctomycetes bacterium]|nr:hypothetical protein [Planctomycetota bacterium]
DRVDISDGIVMLTALFLGGVEVKAPGPFACGLDPTPDEIECDAYEHCR